MLLTAVHTFVVVGSKIAFPLTAKELTAKELNAAVEIMMVRDKRKANNQNTLSSTSTFPSVSEIPVKYRAVGVNSPKNDGTSLTRDSKT